MAEDLTKKLAEAQAFESHHKLGDAMKLYESIIQSPIASPDAVTDDLVKAKEQSTYRLASIYKDKGLVDELIAMQKAILPLFIELPKSKVAKIVRTLFDMTLGIQFAVEGKTREMIELCKYIIDWCEKESRSFLRMRIENKLAELYFRMQKYADALEVLKKLTYELKKKEDKILMVEAQLVESKVYHALENLPKSKAALTSVKTTANAIYVVPALQAEIDMMSGLIATDEKDYTTAYSYFYETFEGYRSLGEASAGHAFKFMLFSKIMNKQSDDALNLINSAVALKYQGRDVDAMKEVALANKGQNLLAFERVKEVYKQELLGDFVINRHFTLLYSSLLEDNLRKIIEPYSEVQIAYIAQQIGLPVDRVLQKLSEMILDEKIAGTLDQGRDCLIVFEEGENVAIFEHSIEVIKNLETVLDSLYDKTQNYKQKYLQ
ncbi:hypothetical protein FGO68_gene14674 [Halteria grandinella]|uniref:PCI domain-containing protein n=1 Tax=Halteria grandinella TaxID=5974 RepID=A0A8J8T212_HALGN|nr:hypothetical protein FGO68_gene14674 [Halteria grandinella]